MAMQHDKIKINQKVAYDTGRGNAGTGRVTAVYPHAGGKGHFVKVHDGATERTLRPGQITPA